MRPEAPRPWRKTLRAEAKGIPTGKHRPYPRKEPTMNAYQVIYWHGHTHTDSHFVEAPSPEEAIHLTEQTFPGQVFEPEAVLLCALQPEVAPVPRCVHEVPLTTRCFFCGARP
jgi:hypothetical protein